MTAPRTGLEAIAAGRRRQALRDGALVASDRQYDSGQLIAAARCYLGAANAVRATLRWANETGPRMAERYQGGSHRDAILADVGRAAADPVGYHYGRDPDGHVKLPAEDWPLAPELWHPDNDPLVNLAQAGALVAREIDLHLLEGHADPEGHRGRHGGGGDRR